MSVKTNKSLITAILLIAAGSLALLAILGLGGDRAEKDDEGRAKYVFLFIGDGMGASHVAATESYLSYKEGKLGGAELTFTGFPVFGTATTYSANKAITCSSAAGTAIACGEKTKNGYLGVDTLKRPLESVAYKLKKEGYKIGIMSTVSINHATPATFYGHNKTRKAHYEIAQEIPQSGFDFIGGKGFLDYYGKDGKKQAITEYLVENGSTVCFGEDEFESRKDGARQIVFCQPSSRNKNEQDYFDDGEEKAEDCGLDDMLSFCMDFIGSDSPFFIMCEGGEIDWRAHANMTMATINDIIGLDDAVKVAYEFYRDHPDETLIVVTADHETGGMSLGGRDDHSKNGSVIDWKILEESWEKNEVLDEKANRELNDIANIGWATQGHGGAPVPVFAIGKGSERFAGRIDNTDIGKFIFAE